MKQRQKRFWTDIDLKRNEQSTNLSAELHGLSCPVCNSRKFTKHGKEKGNQRYRCSKCGKHFRSTTGKTIHHLHLKPKLQQYINCMQQGLSLRKTAKQCDISLQTAFRWRHRFLKAVSKQPHPPLHKNKTISAYVLPYSHKGKTETIHKRLNITSLLQTDITGQTIINVLGKFGNKSTKLAQCTGDYTSIVASRAIPKIFRTKSPNGLSSKQKLKSLEIHNQLNEWLAKFRGVATIYLENYWSWFILMRHTKQESILHQYIHKCL